jgi:hypothetical protein
MDRRSLLSSSGGLNRFIACAVLISLVLGIAGCTEGRSAAGDDTDVDVTASATTPPPASPTPTSTEQDPSTSDDEDVVGEAEDEEQAREVSTPQPTEPPAEEVDENVNWIRYENDEHGYTLEHPEGWIVGSPEYGSLFLANEDIGCGSCRVIPPNSVIATITPGIDPPGYDGEFVNIGDGIQGGIYYGGAADDQDPERVIEVYYHTVRTDWRIYAFFGDPIDDDNELATAIFKVIESIRHQYPPSPPAPDPTPEPTTEYELVRTWTGMDRPTGIAIESTGNVYIADSGNNRVVKVSPDGVPFLEITHNSQGSPLNFPLGVGAADSDGTGFLHITELGRSWVSQYLMANNDQGAALNGWGWDKQSFAYPRGVTVSPVGINAVYVAVNDSVISFNPVGDVLNEVPVGGELWGIALDPVGSVFVTDRVGGRIVRIGASNQILSEWYGFSKPIDIAIDPAGYIYVVEEGKNRVVRLNTQGTVLDAVGSRGMFDGPRGVAVDNDGKVYVSDNTSVKIFKSPWSE